MKRLIRLAAVAALSIGWQVAAVPATQAAGGPSQSSRAASSSCHLGNGVQHVINIVFDNTHFTRDNPNVPSDLEQMPHLLNFLQSNGTLLTNEHTPLISHTATDILTALTGVYGDQMGVPVPCAKGNALCSNANNGRADLLKDEPGGYTGFNGLFGHKYVAPALGGITTVDGATPINGFPGFDGMSAKNTLGYVAAMQEHGVPVTYAYISDAHDKHPTGPASGPGQAGYVAALKSYDDAFAAFFSRLASDGINKSNTLFTVTADEGDHFAGVQQTGCDGVTTPCGYGTNQIGEVNTNMAGLLATEQGGTTPFTVHSDDAPAGYITRNPAHEIRRASG